MIAFSDSNEAMLRKTTILWLLREARRKKRRTIAQDTLPSSRSSLGLEQLEANNRRSNDTLVDRSIPAQVSALDDRLTHGDYATEIQWRSVDYHDKGCAQDIRDGGQDAQAEANADSSTAHNRTSRALPVLGSVTRLELRPKSPHDTRSDHAIEPMDLPDPMIYSENSARELWIARFRSVPNWFRRRIGDLSRRRMARRFKECRLLEEQQNTLLRLTVSDNPPTISLPESQPVTQGDFDVFSNTVEVTQLDEIVREELPWESPQEPNVGTPIYDFFVQQRR
jgi:hypothetical protein